MQRYRKMDKTKTLHIMISSPFLAPFIDFVDEYFGRENHHYVFVTGEKYEYGLTEEHKVEFLHTDDDIFIKLLGYMKIAKKIILHGLRRDKVDVILYFNKKLLKKCYWIMWGGDFYFPEKQSKIRHEVIKNMGYLVTGTTGDYELVKKLYKAKGSLIGGIINYPSNIFSDSILTKKTKSKTVRILVGNSATITNNHIEIFYKLKKYKDENIKIFTPLSYGDKKYALEIADFGKKIFKDKFIPLFDFMPYTKYLEFLASIDIAIFAHERQQATGITTQLLGLGKKVFIKKNSTLFSYYKNNGIIIFDFNEMDIKPLKINLNQYNIKSIKEKFSTEALVKSLEMYLL